MCSTPKPRTKVAGKTTTSASFLSSMPAQTRHRFTEKANIAQARRDEIKMAEKQQRFSDKAPAVIKNKAAKANTQKSLSYWLLTASVKEICKLLFLGQSKASEPFTKVKR